jgi:SAM-dependent MidA family methyltransferase
VIRGSAEPVPFSTFLEAALYGEHGFYTTGGRAGRRGDFLTSPEVGPLFGAVVARALDTWWDELGQPGVYRVVEAGAGPGTLGRAVMAAQPRCLEALSYLMVERSTLQREHHPVGPALRSSAEMPNEPVSIVLANELLDNIPFDLLVYDGAWREAWITREADGRFSETLRATDQLPATLAKRPTHGARAPRQAQAAAWLQDALRRLTPGGRVVVFDYCSTTAAMSTRPWREWLRTYRQHERGEHYLKGVGGQDITCEVALDQLPLPDAVRTQAQWLALHGIDQIVDEGRAVWAERSAIGDLAALTARSRVREAEALIAPDSLGAFTVAEWLEENLVVRAKSAEGQSDRAAAPEG